MGVAIKGVISITDKDVRIFFSSFFFKIIQEIRMIVE